MSSPIEGMEATFPIPSWEIRKRKLKIAVGSPMTWVSMLPGVTAYATGIVEGWGLAAVAAGTGSLLYGYWKKEAKNLDKGVVTQLVAESNLQQNAAIKASMEKFSDDGATGYAIYLGKFLLLKKEIENALHSDGELTKEKEQVETLVDNLCISVVDVFAKLVEADKELRGMGANWQSTRAHILKQTRRNLMDEINQAYRTLEETYANLETILNPIQDTPAQSSKLSGLIDRLREENEIAIKIRDRMSRDAHGDMPDPVPSREIQ